MAVVLLRKEVVPSIAVDTRAGFKQSGRRIAAGSGSGLSSESELESESLRLPLPLAFGKSHGIISLPLANRPQRSTLRFG